MFFTTLGRSRFGIVTSLLGALAACGSETQFGAGTPPSQTAKPRAAMAPAQARGDNVSAKSGAAPTVERERVPDPLVTTQASEEEAPPAATGSTPEVPKNDAGEAEKPGGTEECDPFHSRVSLKIDDVLDGAEKRTLDLGILQAFGRKDFTDPNKWHFGHRSDFLHLPEVVRERTGRADRNILYMFDNEHGLHFNFDAAPGSNISLKVVPTVENGIYHISGGVIGPLVPRTARLRVYLLQSGKNDELWFADAKTGHMVPLIAVGKSFESFEAEVLLDHRCSSGG